MIQINELFETQHGVLWHNAQKDFCTKEKTITIYSAILGKQTEKTTISSSSKNTYQQMKNNTYPYLFLTVKKVMGGRIFEFRIPPAFLKFL